MTQAAAQASAFYQEVARHRRVWTLRGDKGFPTSRTPEGHAIPFWSSLARAQHIATTVASYAGYEPVELGWEEFRDRWLPDLEREGLRIGVNWTGARAIGYDLTPADLRRNVEAFDTTST